MMTQARAENTPKTSPSEAPLKAASAPAADGAQKGKKPRKAEKDARAKKPGKDTKSKGGKGRDAKADKAGKNKKAGKAKKAAKAMKVPKAARKRIEVHQSGVHGKGVFAVAEIPPGDLVIEYKGELITWPEALDRHPHDPSQPNHTFYFHIDDGRVIDGNVDGNAARWINHACEPNCEADEHGSQVFIKSLRPIMPGEELFYDYGLIIDARYTKKLKKEFECRCGFPSCRGTMLSPKKR